MGANVVLGIGMLGGFLIVVLVCRDILKSRRRRKDEDELRDYLLEEYRKNIKK